MKKLHTAIIALTLAFTLVVPQVAFALTDAQISSILGLLRAFDAEESVLENVSATLQGNTPTASSNVKYEDTLQLSRNLSRGMKGSDIERLQRYLRSVGDYSEDITGYYGVRTEEAVKRWQAKNGVVSSGMPSTTGYGSVGPSTRTALTRAAQRVVVETSASADQLETVNTPQIPDETGGVETATLPTPTIPDETGGVETVNTPQIPDEGPGVDRVEAPSVSVYADGDIYSLEEGNSISLLWRSNNATSCAANFNPRPNSKDNNLFIESGSLSGTSGSVVVTANNIRSFSFGVLCQNGLLSVEDRITITVEPVLPTSAQKQALLDLARSFGAPTEMLSLFESVLEGEVVQSGDSRLISSPLSETQVQGLLSLMSSFGLSESVRSSGENVLRGKTTDLDRAVQQVLGLIDSFGGSRDLRGLADEALHGVIFRAGDSRLVSSSLTDTQIRSLVDLARQLSFSESIIASLSVVLNGKQQTETITSKYILGSEYFKVHDPEFVYDASLGNLMYFVAGVTTTTPEGIYMASRCPNGTQFCSSAVKVIDTKALGIEKVTSPTVVTLTDPGSGRDYHIMYFSGTSATLGTTGPQPEIFFSTSWVGDGVNWSEPKVLLSGYRFPEAVRDFRADFSSPGQGEVLLFASYANKPGIALFRMSMTGVNATGPQTITLPGSNNGYASVDVALGCDQRCYYSLYADASSKSKGIFHFYGSGATPAEAITQWHLVGNIAPVNDEKGIGSPTQYRHVYGYTRQNLFYTDGYGYVRTQVASNTFANSFLGKFAEALNQGVRSIANVFTSLFGR